MNAAATPGATVELDDIQGLVRFGYKHLPNASFLLFRVKDVTAACAWLASAPVTTAASTMPLPQIALQVAITSEGLRALKVSQQVRDGFSLEFVAGMASDAYRAQRLGDIGASDPKGWRWGAGECAPHVAVLLYAATGLAEWEREIEAQCADGFTLLERLRSSGRQDIEPFGFADGISQPDLDWGRTREVRDRDRLAYDNLSCLGEFLLGYPNEYGLYTPRPLLDRRDTAAAALPPAEDDPASADLGRNGSYLVMRQLRQDVTGFWRELDRQAGGDVQLRERLAAAMVGRNMNGDPLVAAAGAATGARFNAFTYESDPRGERCPIGAHIRRANPRNADLPPGKPGIVSRLRRMLGFDARVRAQDLIASTRFHRLLRRGRKYDGGGDDGSEAGLHFICLAANITRQFEFVQSAWMMGTRFGGLTGQSDPVVGNRAPAADGSPADGFSMPRSDGPDLRLAGLPQFVTVVGGAYFFLPGARALRYLATAA